MVSFEREMYLDGDLYVLEISLLKIFFFFERKGGLSELLFKSCRWGY
jgi:hypothetical protein